MDYIMALILGVTLLLLIGFIVIIVNFIGLRKYIDTRAESHENISVLHLIISIIGLIIGAILLMPCFIFVILLYL